MPFTWRINIRPNPHPPGPAIFEFDQPPQIVVGDQIFWSNDDTIAHFPTPANQSYAFMANQIAAKSTSPGFAPSTPGTISYICSLHPAETGTIVVHPTWRINIKPNPHPPGPAIFEFDQPPQIVVGDQIFWSNNDTIAHFPTPVNQTYVFMTNQIAAQSTSPAFAPSAPGTISYICSLHPVETGTIVVLQPPPTQQRGQINETV